MSGNTDSRPWHFIRPNHANRYPRRIVCFDTEANIRTSKQYEKQTFKLAVASFDQLDPDTLEAVKSEQMAFVEPLPLWEWIASKATVRRRVIVFAHNLSYDMRISDALRILYGLGFELTFLTLDSNRTVARFAKGGRSLVLVDLASWFPTTLEKLGTYYGLKKTPLPS